MRKFRKYIIITLLVVVATLFISACNRKTNTSFTNTVLTIKDSISIVEKTILDTIVIPADTILQTIQIECDSITNKPKPFLIQEKGKRIGLSLELSNKGILSTNCYTDSLLNIITYKEREIAVWKALAYSKDTYEIEYIKYIPKFYKICFLIAISIIGLTTLKFILKWRKIINPLW